MMHARNVCHDGAVMDALAIYDGIVQSITSSPMLSSRHPKRETTNLETSIGNGADRDLSGAVNGLPFAR
jgi:hypothetical protein